MLDPQTDYRIDRSTGPVSAAFQRKRVDSFAEALEWTHQLRYARNSRRGDYMLIFSEERGTCSTKHAALATLCRENGVEVQLQVAICKLDVELDSSVTGFLDALGAEFFPEAHCYLRYASNDIDVSFPEQSPTLKAKVLEHRTIEPEQIGDHKLAIHHEYLRRWLVETALDKRFTFDEVWRLREEWIARLSS